MGSGRDPHRTAPTQGDIWWAELPEAGRRPVLVVTRDQALGVLKTVLVAPITRTVRGIPTEVPLGPDEGLNDVCAATFDNLQPIPRWSLTDRAGSLGRVRDSELCRALGAVADCW
ncbi:MAG: type II toxin-antitoxin system PemK/MazF family toxin [Egibacteraceae bacterium]